MTPAPSLLLQLPSYEYTYATIDVSVPEQRACTHPKRMPQRKSCKQRAVRTPATHMRTLSVKPGNSREHTIEKGVASRPPLLQFLLEALTLANMVFFGSVLLALACVALVSADGDGKGRGFGDSYDCLLYTSPSPRDRG